MIRLQFECGHFKKTNAWLRERYGAGEEIDWNLDVPATKPSGETGSDIPEPQTFDGPNDEAALIEAAEQAEIDVLAARTSKGSDLAETDLKAAENLDSDAAAIQANGTVAVQDHVKGESESSAVAPPATKEEEATK